MKSTTNSPEIMAEFRYTVIAPLVSRPLAFGELRALIAEQAARIWTCQVAWAPTDVRAFRVPI